MLSKSLEFRTMVLDGNQVNESIHYLPWYRLKALFYNSSSTGCFAIYFVRGTV